MKITAIRTTPLLVPYKIPYHWSQGVIYGADTILVEVETDTGLTGIGESIGTPTAAGLIAFIQKAAQICIGHSPFENTALMGRAYHELFEAHGTCSSPRFAGQVLAGLEMALWDLMGKATGQPVHALLGGALRSHIEVFAYPQGDTPEEIAANAVECLKSGSKTVYVKVGRGDDLDFEIVRQTRAAVGPAPRLRLDPNEHWTGLRAVRMMRKLAQFDIDMVEQPTPAESPWALQQIRSTAPVGIAADQAVFTPQDAYNICTAKAADMITIGLHETGGIARFRKVAHIAEAAGINICLHGLYETGITTAATNQAAATIANLDDANQYMNHLLAWDVVASPDLSVQNGQTEILTGPGLGITLDAAQVQRAAQAHRNQSG